ncbi:MAG: hypothetical protein QOI37_631, partial [Chloroflexota bacterium]|nr:hypothetical protein [Chloroflexota bacterium]
TDIAASTNGAPDASGSLPILLLVLSLIAFAAVMVAPARSRR